MENVTFVEIETPEGTQEHAIIDRGNGEFTSMPKAIWDELEAAKEAQSL
jgi:acyl-CoA thioesterase FadM